MKPTYLENHKFSAAFLAHHLERLVSLILEQSTEMLQDADVVVPTRAVSIVLLIGEQGAMTAADIAGKMHQPHQLVTQKVELLLQQKIIKRIEDPNDRRRKLLKLTPRGQQQFDALSEVLEQAHILFCDLVLEIDPAFIDAIGQAIRSLEHLPMKDRMGSAPETAARSARR